MTPTETSVPQHARATDYLWSFPGCPLRIRISLDLVSRIRSYLAGPADAGPASELGGLLLGSVRGSAIHINEFAPWPLEGPAQHFVLSDTARSQLKTFIEILNASGEGLSVLGYFRSDCREGIRLYDADLVLIEDLFRDASSVFLVVEHAGVAPTAGFFFWSEGKVFSNLSFMEFAFDERILEAASTPEAAHPSGDPPPDNVPANEQPKDTLAYRAGAGPPFLAGPKRRVPVALLAAVATAALVTCGVFLAYDRAGPQKQAPVIGLSIRRSGADLLVRWKGDTPLVRDARVGIVTIKDGGLQRDIPLTASQVQSMSLVYTPQSDPVNVALEIFSQSGTSAREEVTILSGVTHPLTPPEPEYFRVHVPVAVDPVQTRTRLEPRPAPQSPRSFVPPTHDAIAVEPEIASPADAPVEIAREDVRRLNAPSVTENPAPVAPPEPKQVLTQPPPAPDSVAVQKPIYHPPVPIRPTPPSLPPNVKAMLSARIDIKVQVKVDETGKVTAAEPLSINGSLARVLGSAAANAARLWKFEPATQGSKKVPGELTLEFAFFPERAKF